MNHQPPLVGTVDLPFPRTQGKVRDIFDLGEFLLVVVTDRISTFDCVHPELVPWKGHVLNQLSNWWMQKIFPDILNHIVTDNVMEMPESLHPYAEFLQGRSALVRKEKMLPVECIVRGYLTGSGLKDYNKTGKVCGIHLPPGLKEASKLPEEIFTPSTKAESGHDENISFPAMVALFVEKLSMSEGDAVTLCEDVQGLSIRLYEEAAGFALGKGIILADTKFELGLNESGKLVWADEALTPDSSRFWLAAGYKEGDVQPSLDKQPLRNWATASGWDKKPPAPVIPPEVVKATSERYLEAFHRLTGESPHL